MADRTWPYPVDSFRSTRPDTFIVQVASTDFRDIFYHGGAFSLESALYYQKVEHVALGVLAVQEKYLTELQLCIILNSQRKRGGLFGEIAIELDFIKMDDVGALLKMQGEKHIRIGEVLVLFGAIIRDDMESCLQRFHAPVREK